MLDSELELWDEKSKRGIFEALIASNTVIYPTKDGYLVADGESLSNGRQLAAIVPAFFGSEEFQYSVSTNCGSTNVNKFEYTLEVGIYDFCSPADKKLVTSDNVLRISNFGRDPDVSILNTVSYTFKKLFAHLNTVREPVGDKHRYVIPSEHPNISTSEILSILSDYSPSSVVINDSESVVIGEPDKFETLLTGPVFNSDVVGEIDQSKLRDRCPHCEDLYINLDKHLSNPNVDCEYPSVDNKVQRLLSALLVSGAEPVNGMHGQHLIFKSEDTETLQSLSRELSPVVYGIFKSTDGESVLTTYAHPVVENITNTWITNEEPITLDPRKSLSSVARGVAIQLCGSPIRQNSGISLEIQHDIADTTQLLDSPFGFVNGMVSSGELKLYETTEELKNISRTVTSSGTVNELNQSILRDIFISNPGFSYLLNEPILIEQISDQIRQLDTLNSSPQ